MNKEECSDHECNILNILLYYDIFDYPLTEDEILNNYRLKVEKEFSCKSILQSLVKKEVVYKFEDYYTLNSTDKNLLKRKVGNLLSEKCMKKALFFSKLINVFPYVRAIFLSGSLSKNFMNIDSDIDYFIITKPNRIWLTRTLLVLLKKIFLLNSYRHFCINYFVDTNNLEIDEKNIFTATEILTLVPIYGTKSVKKFFDQNRWVKKNYPNFNGNPVKFSKDNNVIKKIFELLFNNRVGDCLDDYFFKLSVKYWDKKFRNKYSQEEFRSAIRANKYVSKHHPGNFQNIVLKEYRKKVVEFKNKYNIVIDDI